METEILVIGETFFDSYLRRQIELRMYTKRIYAANGQVLEQYYLKATIGMI
jgi:hypothetical protein